MFISRGGGESKTANQTFKLTYMESSNPYTRSNLCK